jgi:hypothetical protein
MYNAISVKALAIYAVLNLVIHCHGLYLATDVVNWVIVDWHVVDTMKKATKMILPLQKGFLTVGKPVNAIGVGKKGISHVNVRIRRA